MRISIRKLVVPIVMALVGLTAFVSPVFAQSGPSSEWTAPSTLLTGRLCETSGSFCVGSATVDLFAVVSERNPGRTVDLIDQGTIFMQHEVYKIVLNVDPTKCVAAANDLSHVVIHSCGDSGVDWARDPNTNGHLRFFNREATNALNSKQYLTGFDDGGDFFLEPGGRAGFFYAFDLS
jgi:hypothetical protein